MSTGNEAFPVAFDIDDGNGGQGCPSQWTPEDGETVVSVHNPDREQGYPVDEGDPLGWLNSARVHLDPEGDAVTLTVSTDDPRGAFAVTVRRIPDDAPNNAGQLIMYLPHPDDGWLHAPLTAIAPGAYIIGGGEA